MFRHSRYRLQSLIIFTCIVCTCWGTLSSCSEKKKQATLTGSVSRSGISYHDMLKKADIFIKKAEFDSALKYYQQANIVIGSENKWEEYLNTLLKQVDILRTKGHNDEAYKKLAEAQKIYDSKCPGKTSLQADILHRKGILLMDKGNFDSSSLAFNQSIGIRIKATNENDTSLALTYNGLGTISFFKGDYNGALSYYLKAYNLALKRKQPEDADLAYFLQNTGIIYAQLGDFSQAETALTSSLKINEKISPSDDPDLANRYLNMGRFMALINKDSESLSYYDKSEAILIKKVGANHPDIGSLYQNKGQTYIHMADYEKALLYFKKALAIATSNYEAGHPNILSINMNIGYVYEKKGEFKNALSYYIASLSSDNNNPSTVKTYGNLASLYNAMNDPARADQYYDKAINLAVKVMGKEHPETGLLYTRYGYFLITSKQVDRSLEMFSKALEISKKNYGNKSREVSNNLTHIGNYYLIRNDMAKALTFYQDAIIAYVKDFNDKNLTSNPSVKQIEPDRYLVNALNGKAEALSIISDENSLNNSLETYKLSIAVIEKLRSSYQNEDSKLLLSEDERKTFLSTVNIASRLYKTTGNRKFLEEAFLYSEKGKSAVLLASIRDIEAKQFGRIPENIQQREKKLKLDLGSYNRFTYEERQKPNPDENKIKFWESKIFDLEQKYDSLVALLEKDYSDYYNLKYKEPDLSIQKIQSQIEPGRALIEYTLSDSLLYIFVVNQKRFDLITHRLDSSFYKNISTLRNATNSSDMMSLKKEDYINYTQAAHALYNDLLKPCKGIIDEKKLIIIPDSELGYISFDMLLTEKADTNKMDFRLLHFLILDHTISYSASAILQYSGLNKHLKKATRNLLAMAPSYNNLTNLEKDGFIDENGNKVFLLPIPGVEAEIKGIKKALSGRTLNGTDATEKNFKAIASQYNILHFAMHTLVNNEKPMLSKLVFYQDKDSVEDGMLNAYELFGMDLNAGLAVLSACNTGTGKLMKGEGMMNLARGFIYAGVPGIVMTMWSVDDQSSAEIVESFYKYLDKGLSKDEALRQAKLDLLAQGDPLKSYPYYWAAYVTIGDYSPMKFVKPIWMSVYFSLLGLASFAMIIVQLIFYKKLLQKRSRTATGSSSYDYS